MSVGESGGAQVKSAVRTVELLEYFAGRPGMHSLASVQEAVGYPKSSLYMLLRTLVELGTRQSQHYLRPFTRVGRRLPAHSTSLGKALLSTYTDEQVRKMLPETLPALTEHTLTDREKLIEELHAVREQGYAVDREENTLGLRCFGVAIPYRTPARDAISCS